MPANPHQLPSSPREVSRFLDAAYAQQRGLACLLIRWRPYICPFEELLKRLPPDASVLDVGCGTGIMSVLAAGPGQAREVTGFDISPESIAIARKARLEGAAPTTFHTLPVGEFPPGVFDVVVCIDVLHHVPPQVQLEFLNDVCRHVAAGGLLILKDTSPRPWWKALANRMHDLVIARQWVNYRHERDVAAHLRGVGGDVTEETRLDRLWYGHYLVCWRKNATS